MEKAEPHREGSSSVHDANTAYGSFGSEGGWGTGLGRMYSSMEGLIREAGKRAQDGEASAATRLRVSTKPSPS